MRFDPPLVAGVLLRRYKRFLADVDLASGEVVTAHCPNPGSMLGLADPGRTVWLSRSDDPKRKLAHTLELVDAGTSLVGVNTGRANRLVEEALDAGLPTDLGGYARRRREVRFGDRSRVDFLLEDDGRPPCYLEVKSVTLARRPGIGEFPDAVTARGARHLAELATVAGTGSRAVLLYLVQREDCDRVVPAADIDPAYTGALAEAIAAGVEVHALGCAVTPDAIEGRRVLPVAAGGAT